MRADTAPNARRRPRRLATLGPPWPTGCARVTRTLLRTSATIELPRAKPLSSEFSRMTARIRYVLAALVEGSRVSLEGSAALYATHVQDRLAGQESAHLSDLLRDAVLTVQCMRQPRQKDQGPTGWVLRCGAALQQADRGLCAVALVRLVRLAGLVGLLGLAWPVGLVGCFAASKRVRPQAALGSGLDHAAVAPSQGRYFCPNDMVALPSFCMDRYEAPNVRGELPLAMKTAGDGEAWCAERGKRLCTEEQWVRACQGPHGRLYPYGDEHRESACNDDRRWLVVHWERLAQWPSEVAVNEAASLFQADPSGARAGCVSEEGVYDLTGNVAEWVRRSDGPPKPGYDHVLKGCYWAGCYHEPHPNCVFRNSAHPGSFRTYEAGFRCCAERAS